MKFKRYKPAEEPLRKAVELSPENELANNLFELTTMVTGEEKPGEIIDKLREVVFLNPEHIQGHQQLSKAYDETLSGKKAITHTIIMQRLQADKKLMKGAARSRESLKALYKKYKMTPDELKKSSPPAKTTSVEAPQPTRR